LLNVSEKKSEKTIEKLEKLRIRCAKLEDDNKKISDSLNGMKKMLIFLIFSLNLK